jgi:hypothetical protein
MPELVTACGASTQPAAPASPAAAPAPLRAGDAAVVGTVVRFTSATTSVDVTIGEDIPATRDFLSMLPLTLACRQAVSTLAVKSRTASATSWGASIAA